MAKGGNTDAAWDWVEFALGPEGQEVLAASGRSVPSLRAVAESPVFLESADPPANSQVFLDALEHMHLLPTTENWTAVEQQDRRRAGGAVLRPHRARRALERIAQETDGQF